MSDPSLTLLYDFTRQPDLRAINGLGPTLGITRADPARFYDYDNVLRTVPAGEARFTGCRRVENLVLQSEAFDNAAWTEQRSTVTANQAVAPDGTTTMDHVANDGTVGSSGVYNTAITFPESATITASCYMKVGELNWAKIDVGSNGETQYGRVWFDLDAGSVGTITESTFSVVSSGMEDVGGGIYRCWSTVECTGQTDISTLFRIASSDGNSITEDQTDNGIYLWGAQLENVSGQADPSPSEYQATTTVAVAQTYTTKRRTNLCLQSEDLSTTWTAFGGGATLTLNDTTAPDGTLTADKLNRIDGNNDGVYQIFSLKTVGTYTVSAYFKIDDANRGQISILKTGFSSHANVAFDWTDGVPSTQGAANASDITYTLVDQGFYRISFTFTADVAATHYLVLYPEFNGAGTEGSWIWGIQLEPGSDVTEYLPTTDSLASSGFDTAITPTGLLVEEARTNICLQSEDFSTTWSNSGTTETVNSTVAPDGTTTADSLLETATTAVHQFQQNLTVVTATAYTSSIRAKASLGRTKFALRENAATAAYVIFDLSDGTIEAQANGGVGSIVDIGNGYYECSMVATSSGTGWNVGIYILDSTYASGDPSSHTYLGDITKGMVFWGAQLEAGAFPTSYIPTVAASVTRNADAITTTDVGWYTQSVGSVYVDVSLPSDPEGPAMDLVGFHNGTFQESHILYTPASDAGAVVNNRDGNIDQWTLQDTGSFTQGVSSKIAWAMELNDGILYVDGGLAGTNNPDTSGTMPTITELSFGSDIPSFSGASRNVHIAELRYYNERLTNTQLEDMSNGYIDPDRETQLFARNLARPTARSLAVSLGE